MELASQNSELEKAILKIKNEILQNNRLANKELIEICRYAVIKSHQNQAEYRIHDLLETAVNLYIIERYSDLRKENVFAVLADLEDMMDRLPTQSWRDEEQLEFQQFSTPPGLALIMGQFLNPQEYSVALEPSAGTGCLATWLKITGCKVEVNEISERRRGLLELQNYRPHRINAEFLNDLLDENIRPDFILMNPPFSATGGRTKKNSDFGFRHVESALQRLNPGGRLVSLLGNETCLKTDKGRYFWNRIHLEYNIRAFLTVPSNAFYKHGTNFQTVIIVIDKDHPERLQRNQKTDKPPKFTFGSLTELLKFSEVFNQKIN